MADTSNDSAQPIASVIIPAFNEEAVIGRALRRLLTGATTEALQLIVVCNGCMDATADVARGAAPGAIVIELAEASKSAALNAGDEVATAWPRFYVDADVELGFDGVEAVVSALEREGVECAAPACVFVLSDRPWFVRRFYEIWSRLPYVTQELVGNGVYALTEQGRARFDRFPEITADDLFIRNLFAPGERRSVHSASFRVHPPRTMSGLLAVRARTYRGNAEFAARFPDLVGPRTGTAERLIAAARRRPLSFTVYMAINLVAKLRWRVRGHGSYWERDNSARVPASQTAAGR